VEVDDPEMPGERPGDDGGEKDPKNGWAKALGEEESDGEIDTDGVPDPDAPADDE
jgi:hypothetical protein